MNAGDGLDAVLINPPISALDDDRRQPPGGCVSLATVAAMTIVKARCQTLTTSLLSRGDCRDFESVEVDWATVLAPFFGVPEPHIVRAVELAAM